MRSDKKSCPCALPLSLFKLVGIMSQLEQIKHELHQLIDRLDDEAVLTRYLGAMASEVDKPVADFWRELTSSQQADLLDAYAESDNEAKMLSNEAVKQRYTRWLST